MKYTIDIFDKRIIDIYTNELTYYLENFDLSLEETTKRILKNIKENQGIEEDMKPILETVLPTVIFSIFNSGLPPFLLEYNLINFKTKTFNKKTVTDQGEIIGYLGIDDGENFTFYHKVNDPNNIDPYYNLLSNTFHELKHLASSIPNIPNYYQSIHPLLDETFTELIDYPIESIGYFKGYLNLCARMFPIYYYLNDFEKNNIHYVYYGGKKEVIEDKSYFQRIVKLIENQECIDELSAINEILKDDDYKNYFDNFFEKTSKFDPMLTLWLPELYSKGYAICNFLNQESPEEIHRIKGGEEKIKSATFSKNKKVELNEEKIMRLPNLPPYQEIMKISKKNQQIINLLNNKTIQALEKILIINSIPACFSYKIISDLLESMELKRVTGIAINSYMILTILITIFSEIIKKKNNQIQKENEEMLDAYWEIRFLEEKLKYCQDMLDRTRKIYKLKDEFQNTHEYDENHHIKEKRLTYPKE